jgi:hypothetical protein
MDLINLKLGRIFRTFRRGIEDLREDVTEDGGQVLKREEEASVRARFYRTGEGLRSLRDETVTEGPRLIYRLTFGAFYMIFGEHGTGRRGSTSGRPTPRGWRYGQRAGMTARRFSRIAIDKAEPQILRDAQQRISQFAANVTVG